MKTRSTLKFGQPIKPVEHEQVSVSVDAEPGESITTKPEPSVPPREQQKPPSPK